MEELMEVEVCSVGCKLQKVSEAPAVMIVICEEDICLSGANSIPEDLSLAPDHSVPQEGR